MDTYWRTVFECDGNTELDRRIAKTRTALMESLIHLMGLKCWADINVQLICDQADVSRSSFYSHFDNKQELLDFAFSELEKHLSQPHAHRELRENGRLGFLPGLVDHVRSHCDLFKNRERTSADIAIFNRFKSVVDGLVQHELNQLPGNNRPSNDELAFLTGGIFGVLQNWNNRGCVTSNESVLASIDALADRFLSR